MELTQIYVIGELEHIAQVDGNIAIRIQCTRKVHVYKSKEAELPFRVKLCAELSVKSVKLSHFMELFAKGDKVKFTRIPADCDSYDDEEDYDSYSLENLTLNKAEDIDKAIPKHPEQGEFCIDVDAVLKRLETKRGKIYLRLECRKRNHVFFDEHNNMSKKNEIFEKTVCGVIAKDHIRTDIGLRSLAAYKEGDKVVLSRPHDDDYFDFDNRTLFVFTANPKYKTQYDL